MSDPPLLINVEARVAIIRLNRPGSLNAVDPTLRAALTTALPRLDADDAIEAIVLTGSGERAFCAGQDLSEAAELGVDSVSGWLDRQHAMYRSVRDVDKPIVAAINGTAAGAGFQIALLCDLRIAHPTLRMGQPEVKAGLASVVGSWLMSLQIGHSLNQQLSLTGELISGERALEIGLVNELVAREAVLTHSIDRARRLAALPRTAFRATKRRFREYTQSGFDEVTESAARYQRDCYASGEPQRVMREFLAARKGR